MILDTPFFIDLIRGDSGAIERAESIEKGGIPQRIPAQVVYELYVGVGYSERSESEVEKLDNVLGSRQIVETTESIAKRAGRIDGRLRRAGERISPSDIVIGATALAFDDPVLTRNLDDFERIPDVRVETY